MTISYDLMIKEDCSFWYDIDEQESIVEHYEINLKDIFDFKFQLKDLAMQYKLAANITDSNFDDKLIPIGLKASDAAVTFIGCIDEMYRNQFVVKLELYFENPEPTRNGTIAQELLEIYPREIYVLTPEEIRIINTND